LIKLRSFYFKKLYFITNSYTQFLSRRSINHQLFKKNKIIKNIAKRGGLACAPLLKKKNLKLGLFGRKVLKLKKNTFYKKIRKLLLFYRPTPLNKKISKKKFLFLNTTAGGLLKSFFYLSYYNTILFKDFRYYKKIINIRIFRKLSFFFKKKNLIKTKKNVFT